MNFNQTKQKKNWNIINTLKDEITYGGYLAALGSPCLIISTSIILNINIDIPILLISYLLPLIIYSYDYYKDIDKDIKNKSVRAIYLKEKAKNYPYLLSLYILFLISLLFMYANYILVAFIIGIIMSGILYNYLFKNWTKKIPIFKNIFTTLIWALVGAFFPLFYYSMDINVSFIIVFLLIFMRCIINVIFFDLKDVSKDRESGLKTLPVIVGKQNTINILYALNIIAFIPLIFGVYFNLVNLKSISLIIFVVYGYFYIGKANSASSDELESVSHTLADSEFILWPLLLTAVQLFFKF